MSDNIPPGYKMTEVGVIPEDWEDKVIGDVVDFSGGSQPPRSTFIFSPKEGYIRLIQIRDYKTDEYATYIPESSAKKKCTTDDIMIGRYGPPIFQILRGIEGAYNVALIKVIHSNKVDHEYLYHFLKQETLFRFIELLSQRSSGQTGIEIPALKGYPFPLPPVTEQRAIADALSEVDAQITALDEAIAKKRDLKQGTMQRLFTGEERLPGFSGAWREWSFNDLFITLKTASNPRSHLSDAGDVKYIHYGDIHQRWTTYLDCEKEELPYIDQSLVQTIPHVKSGDLIMADASEDYEGIGASVEVKNVGDMKVVAGLHTLLLRGNDALLADGFKGYLQYIPDVKRQLIEKATGISVYGISKHSIKSIMTSLPDIDEQLVITTVLSDIDVEISALEEQREKTVALKQGMMQELLTGKTRLV